VVVLVSPELAAFVADPQRSAKFVEDVRAELDQRQRELAVRYIDDTLAKLVALLDARTREVSEKDRELETIYERREPLNVSAETDGADPAVVRLALLQCIRAWEPEARILGNVRAWDAERAIVDGQDRCAALEAENAELRTALAEIAERLEQLDALGRFTKKLNEALAAKLEAVQAHLAVLDTAARVNPNPLVRDVMRSVAEQLRRALEGK
jgi:hypothetical protein